jgi:hypothetical protein
LDNGSKGGVFQMSDLSLAIQDVVLDVLCNMNTAMPGVVNSYNPVKVCAEILPLLKRNYLSGEAPPAKPIVDVPVMFMRTNRFRCTFPLERGDTGLLLFGQRDMSEWLTGDGKEALPGSGRKFSLTDAIFIPGLFAFRQGSLPEDGSKFELAFDDVKIVSNGQSFQFTGDVAVTGKITATDNIESDSEVKAGVVALSTHTHPVGTIASPYIPANPLTGATGSPA